MRVRFYRKLTVKFGLISMDEVLGESTIPDRLMLQSAVAVLHEDRAVPAILTLPTIEPDLDRALSKILRALRKK